MNEIDQGLQDQLIDAKSQLRIAESECEKIKKQFFEAGERYKTNLRAIHFLLSELQDVGTHHEKEVALRYVKLVIEKHLIKTIAYYPGDDYLPF